MKQKEERFAEIIYFKILMHKKLLLYIVYVQAYCPYEPIFFSFPIPLLCVLHLPGAMCLIVCCLYMNINSEISREYLKMRNGSTVSREH
jgi:hypothetical protein